MSNSGSKLVPNVYVPRQTKIVATLGPASTDPAVLERMIAAGMNVVRVNFSHGTAQEHIEAGKKVVESGISLSEYVMPGLGGRKWAKEHPIQTARVLNEINPDFIRLRSLVLREDLPLYRKMKEGEFELLSDDGVVVEIAEFVQE